MYYLTYFVFDGSHMRVLKFHITLFPKNLTYSTILTPHLIYSTFYPIFQILCHPPDICTKAYMRGMMGVLDLIKH